MVSENLASGICVVASCNWILFISQLGTSLSIDTVIEIAETQLQIP